VKNERLKQEQRKQTNSRIKLNSVNLNISCRHYNTGKCRSWIIVFTETGRLPDNTSWATQQTDIDACRCDPKLSIGKMCKQDYLCWVGSWKICLLFVQHIVDGISYNVTSCYKTTIVCACQVLSLFVKHTWPLICCVFHGNHKAHSACKATHLPVLFSLA